MEHSLELGRGEIVEIFKLWRADELAGRCGGEFDADRSADKFIELAEQIQEVG